MAKILVTGGAGMIGAPLTRQLVYDGHDVTLMDLRSPASLHILREFDLDRKGNTLGSVTDQRLVDRLVQGQDYVIHLAAVLPPKADANHELAQEVNISGLDNIIRAIINNQNHAVLIFASSVSVYGNRLDSPEIHTDDLHNPGEDYYALTKSNGEKHIKLAGIKYAIFQLGAVFGPELLKPQPLMFKMPLETKIEWMHKDDAAMAFARAIGNEAILEQTLHLAGGEACRCAYKEFLEMVYESLGFGQYSLPKNLFSKKGWHCGYMADSEKTLQILDLFPRGLIEIRQEIEEIGRTDLRFKALRIIPKRLRQQLMTSYLQVLAEGDYENSKRKA